MMKMKKYIKTHVSVWGSNRLRNESNSLSSRVLYLSRYDALTATLGIDVFDPICV